MTVSNDSILDVAKEVQRLYKPHYSTSTSGNYLVFDQEQVVTTKTASF